MMPSDLNGGGGSGRFFLQVQLEIGFWHLGQIRPVSVEYTRRVLAIIGKGPFNRNRHVLQPSGPSSAGQRLSDRHRGLSIE
jgi:hypothetical protein